MPQRIGNLSRAYRVNLTVLALVALFTGAFLVFSVLALGVAQRAPQFALLAVLGATPRTGAALAGRPCWGWWAVPRHCAGHGAGGHRAATAGATWGRLLANVQPTLHWSGLTALLYGALVLSPRWWGWWPARAARTRRANAQGLGATAGPGANATTGII